MANKIVHFEIMGADGATLAGFYRDVFGWSPEGMEGFEGYHLVSEEDTGVGGAVGQGAEEMPSYLTVYLGVDDIDTHLDQISAAGGTTVVPRQVVPGVVAFALFRDPAGNVVGLAENETPPAE